MNYLNEISKINNTNTLMLGRSLLALSFLATLLFTPLQDLFPVYHLEKLVVGANGLFKLNYFLWFENIYIPYIISIIVLILTILGLYPRYLSILHAWVTYSIFYTMLIVEGGDQICTIITLLLIPICILDDRTIGWRSINKPNNNDIYILKQNSLYAILFIKIQIAILYFNAGISKIFAPEWSNGTAVYYWFNDVIFGAPNWLQNSIGFLFTYSFTVSVINWSVIFLEILLFIALFLKQSKKYQLFLLAFIFHFSIVIVHGLVTFWISMSGCLILYLFDLQISISDNLKNLKYSLTKHNIINEKYL